MIYTSYFGQLKNLERDGIEPIAISRSQPKGFTGQKRLDLAPTWAMLKMSDAQYDECYERILSRMDVDAFIKEYEGRDVALLCWEKDINECHRKRVGEWLRAAGCEVEEYSPTTPPPKKSATGKNLLAGIQLSFL